MAFKEKTIKVPTHSGELVKHWISCPTAYHYSVGNDIFTENGYNRYACTCTERATSEYWRIDQLTNCAYESTGELKPKQLAFGVVSKVTYPTGKVERFTDYCCSKSCADRYRKEFC